MAEESIKKGLCKTMIKIINNQKTIKSFSLRLVDLNGSVVKTITEAQYPVSTTIEISFTEDDYNITDDRLLVKLSVTYKDSIIKYIESTNFDAMAVDMEVTVFDSAKKPSINLMPKTKNVTKNTDTDKTYVYVKSIFDEYTQKNKDIITAKDNASLSKDYATQSLESSREAERYKNQAFLATPEGYETVAEKVVNLDLVSERGNAFIRENTSKGKCLINKVYGMSEQELPSPTSPKEIKDFKLNLKNSGKNLTYFPYSNHAESQFPFTYNFNGIMYTFKQDGSIVLNGQTDSEKESAVNINSPYDYELCTDLVENRTYYITDGREGEETRHPNGYCQFVLVSEDGEILWLKNTVGNTSNSIATFTKDKNIDPKFTRWGIRVCVSKNQACNNVVMKPMVSFSDDLTYEKGLPRDTIETDIVLRALEVEPNDTYNFVKNGKYYIADTLEETDKGYQIVRRVGHKVFDGSENWSKADTEIADKYRKTLILSDVPSYTQLCTTTTTPNKKGYITSSAYPEEMTNGLLHPYKGAQTIGLHDTQHWIQVYDERYNKADDIEQWKAHLAEEPLVINYRLYKETVEQVSTTDMEKLCNLISSEKSTSLALNSDIDTDMEVMIPYSNTTAKALEGNVQSKLNATKLLELQTALLEMGGLS